MLLTKAKTRKHFENIESLYEETFPFEERKSFDMMMKYNGKTFEIIVIEKEEHGEFFGFIILVKFKDLILIDYFALVKEMRNRGLGSEILNKLLDEYKNKKIFLEIESTEILTDNFNERLQRKEFYKKNNFRKVPFNVELFGIEMEILSHNCDLSENEYIELYLNQFNGELTEKIKNNVKIIKI